MNLPDEIRRMSDDELLTALLMLALSFIATGFVLGLLYGLS